MFYDITSLFFVQIKNKEFLHNIYIGGKMSKYMNNNIYFKKKRKIPMYNGKKVILIDREK